MLIVRVSSSRKHTTSWESIKPPFFSGRLMSGRVHGRVRGTASRVEKTKIDAENRSKAARRFFREIICIIVFYAFRLPYE